MSRAGSNAECAADFSARLGRVPRAWDRGRRESTPRRIRRRAASCPGGVLPAATRSSASNSLRVRYFQTETPVEAAAASIKWRCESMKPGMTVRPAILSRWVRGPTIDFKSANLPCARIEPSRIATESLSGCPKTTPFVKNQVGFINRHLLLESSTHPHPFRSAPSPRMTAFPCRVAISLKREAAWPP